MRHRRAGAGGALLACLALLAGCASSLGVAVPGNQTSVRISTPPEGRATIALLRFYVTPGTFPSLRITNGYRQPASAAFAGGVAPVGTDNTRFVGLVVIANYHNDLVTRPRTRVAAVQANQPFYLDYLGDPQSVGSQAAAIEAMLTGIPGPEVWTVNWFNQPEVATVAARSFSVDGRSLLDVTFRRLLGRPTPGYQLAIAGPPPARANPAQQAAGANPGSGSGPGSADAPGQKAAPAGGQPGSSGPSGPAQPQGGAGSPGAVQVPNGAPAGPGQGGGPGGSPGPPAGATNPPATGPTGQPTTAPTQGPGPVQSPAPSPTPSPSPTHNPPPALSTAVVAASANGPSQPGTQVYATSVCPSGAALVGGGFQLHTTDGTDPNNSLRDMGEFPSSTDGSPVGSGSAHAYTTEGGAGGQSMANAVTTNFGLCATGWAASFQVVVNTVFGPSQHATAVPVTAVCPAGTSLIGGGASTGVPPPPAQFQPSLHLIGDFPSDASGATPASGSSPNAWTAIAAAGGADLTNAVTKAFAMCASRAPAVHVVVASAPGPDNASVPQSATAVCPAGAVLLGGGVRADNQGGTPQQGVHLIASFPGAPGAPVTGGPAGTAWTGTSHSGGQQTPGTETSAFALCAEP